MSTHTTDSRLDQLHDRIDRLEAKAHAAGTDAQASVTSQLGGLRRHEESTRTAFSEAVDAKASEASKRAQAADDKYLVLDTRLGAAEQALEADLAADSTTFNDAMRRYLDHVKALFAHLEPHAAAKSGAAHDHAETAMNELRRSRDTVAEHLAEVRGSSGEQWHERKRAVGAARAKLERKIDEVFDKTD